MSQRKGIPRDRKAAAQMGVRIGLGLTAPLQGGAGIYLPSTNQQWQEAFDAYDKGGARGAWNYSKGLQRKRYLGLGDSLWNSKFMKKYGGSVGESLQGLYRDSAKVYDIVDSIGDTAFDVIESINS